MACASEAIEPAVASRVVSLLLQEKLAGFGTACLIFRRVQSQQPRLGAYRGWMLTPERYRLIGRHAKSGMPLSKEFRLFFLDGKLIFWIPYSEEGDFEGKTPPLERFVVVAAAVRSRFFTMDIAERRDGDWLIVELGDGQVAGLPEHADVDEFYKSLNDHWPGR